MAAYPSQQQWLTLIFHQTFHTHTPGLGSRFNLYQTTYTHSPEDIWSKEINQVTPLPHHPATKSHNPTCCSPYSRLSTHSACPLPDYPPSVLAPFQDHFHQYSPTLTSSSHILQQSMTYHLQHPKKSIIYQQNPYHPLQMSQASTKVSSLHPLCKTVAQIQMIVPVTNPHIQQQVINNYDPADQSAIMKHYSEDYMAAHRYALSATSQYHSL